MNSDWESASEAEDFGVSSVGALEQISKDNIYQAYLKSLDKYQKYRGKFTELAKRYRELEKDNAKARQVLVETQDKALRRISELREQCQLEQQAKAHLESALRIEIDDLHCMNSALQTKLELRADNIDHVNGSSSQEQSLINLSCDLDTSSEQDNLIAKLEQELKELQHKHTEEMSKNQLNEQSIVELTAHLDKSREEIKQLKTREEENTIMLAENKMMIHSELENKESEMKKLREKITGMGEKEISLIRDLQTSKESLAKQKSELDVVSKDKLKLEDRLKEVFEEKKAVNIELREMKDKIEKVNSKFKTLSEDKTSLQSQNELLNIEIKKCKDEMNELQRQKALLNEEIKSIKIVAESSESDAISSLQESMKSQATQLETKIGDATKDLKKTIEEKSLEITQCRAKIESLKNERRDHEKTLEREIREKNELKTQVTNILQEIGRLEDQVKNVRESHSSIQVEKQKLEEKIEKIQRQHNENSTAKSKMLKDLEAKLQAIQCENSQLSEKNCLLEESSRRNSDELKKLQSNLSESQDFLRLENNRLIESSRILEEKIKTLNDQLTQCSGDHAKLYDEKERLEHQLRTLQDENETKEKEKLCLIEDVNSQNIELNSVKAKIAQLETEKLNLTECCDNLRIVVENIKKENDAMMKTRDELQKSFDKMKIEFSNQARLRAELETELKQSQEESAKESRKNEELKMQNDRLTSKVKQLEIDADEIREQKLQIEECIARASEKELIADEKIEELSQALSETQSEVINLQQLELAVSSTNKELECLNKGLLKKVNDLENQINRHRDYQQIRDENIALSTQQNVLNQKLAQLEHEKATSNETVRELQNKVFECEELRARSLSMLAEKDDLRKSTEERFQKIVHENEALTDSLKKLEDSLLLLRTSSEEKNNALLAQLKAFADYQEIKVQNEDFEKKNSKLEKEMTVSESENDSLRKSLDATSSQLKTLNEEKSRLEKEIESSRSIIKDLNKDFEDRQKEVESLREEKAAWVAQQEVSAMKLSSESESSAVKPNGKSSNEENTRLQDTNRELLLRLENLEKTSERKISDMTQEIEDLMEKDRLYVHVCSELSELKEKYDQLSKEKLSCEKESKNDDELAAVRIERDELSGRMKKILSEVEDVSNKNIFLEQKVENYLILEQSNERLKLTNEKLSRQLDETLVSDMTKKLCHSNIISNYFFLGFYASSRRGYSSQYRVRVFKKHTVSGNFI